MEITKEVVGFTSGYVTTALDFLIFSRPKQFAVAAARDSDRYMPPVPFLIVSLAFSAIVAFTFTLFQVEAAQQEDVGRFGLLGFGVVVIGLWIFNAFTLAFGKLVGVVLDVQISLRQLFKAYCYTSVLFPLVIATKVIAFGHDDLEGTSLAVAALAEVMFIGVLIVAMGRFGELPSRTHRRFVALTVLCFVAVSVVAGAAIGISERTAQVERAGLALWNTGRTDPNTLRLRNDTRSAACDDCWDTDVKARRGDAISLRIYYRYARISPQAIDARLRLLLPDVVRLAAPVGAEVWSADTPRRAQGVANIVNDGAAPFELTFLDAVWFSSENDSSPSRLPRNQSGAEVITPAGVFLGRVPGKVCKCPGYMVVRFRCE